ncbi:hypothetical protein C900_05950 [Fulvivirga imtechensis AK7]|uniref:Uncharacterized protein n=1 Tax=Fulvivirga imtechensis AK7 TaxID=1237149 RepID=L8JIF6_9BACT|nr:hypothetical protein [Fulvivirga imtechensis]ELR68661.1 hypothetical protein C900_05950 [Fulvivirga imtechensis AK7]
MKLSFQTLYAVAVSVFLTSCIPSARIPEKYDPANEKGLVVGSIAIKNERPIYNSYDITYRKVGSEKFSRIRIIPEQVTKMKLIPDFFDDDRGIHLFALELPPGEYEIYEIYFFSNGGYIQETRRSGEFSLKFSSRPGIISYIGEFNIMPYNILSFTNVKDKMDRDIAYLTEHHPGIPWESADNNTLVTHYQTIANKEIGVLMKYPDFIHVLSPEEPQQNKEKIKNESKPPFNHMITLTTNPYNSLTSGWRRFDAEDSVLYDEYHEEKTDNLLSSLRDSKLQISHESGVYDIDGLTFRTTTITYYSKKKDELLFTTVILERLIGGANIFSFNISYTNEIDKEHFFEIVNATKFTIRN